MPVETIIVRLVVGAVAGLIAGIIVTGGGFGLLGDIVVGIIGAFVGGWLLPRLGIHLGWVSPASSPAQRSVPSSCYWSCGWFGGLERATTPANEYLYSQTRTSIGE